MLLSVAGCGSSTPPPAATTPTASGADPASSTPIAAVDAGAASASEALLFGVVPDSDVLKKLDRQIRMRDLLARKLQRPVELRLAPGYGGIVQGMLRREYHLVRPAPKGYVDGCAGGYEAAVRPVKGRSATYQGMIVVAAESPVKQVSDLQGRSFAFVDSHSASGFLYPLAVLLKNGIDPDRDLTFYNYLGGHDNVVLNVFQRQFDAGACYHDARFSTFREHPERIERLRVLALTDPISNPPIALRTDLPAELKDAIIDIFVHLHESPEGLEVLADLGGITGFERCTDRDYDSVREMQRIVGPWLQRKGIALPDQ